MSRLNAHAPAVVAAVWFLVAGHRRFGLRPAHLGVCESSGAILANLTLDSRETDSLF